MQEDGWSGDYHDLLSHSPVDMILKRKPQMRVAAVMMMVRVSDRTKMRSFPSPYLNDKACQFICVCVSQIYLAIDRGQNSYQKLGKSEKISVRHGRGLFKM